MLDLNAHYRTKLARQPTMIHEQLTALIRELNQARTDLRLAAALIRLHGPDELADMAAKVVDADQAMYRLLKESGNDPLELITPPARLREAGEKLDSVATAFAKAARSWTQ